MPKKTADELIEHVKTLKAGDTIWLQRTVLGDGEEILEQIAVEITYVDPDGDRVMFDLPERSQVFLWFHEEGRGPLGWELSDSPEFDPFEAAEEPKALALNLPRGANWLMAKAAELETEAEKYTGTYGTHAATIRAHIQAAAGQLRAVVGAALVLESETTPLTVVD